MPDQEAVERAREDAREGKSPSTQAGEFVREEIHHIRDKEHGARSAKQAIAIGLSEARRAGVKVPAPRKGTVSARTRKSIASATRAGAKSTTKSTTKSTKKRASPTRSRAITEALKREGTAAGSERALSRHAHAAAKRRTAAQRSASAKKAARTKGPAERSAAARKAARTRAKG